MLTFALPYLMPKNTAITSTFKWLILVSAVVACWGVVHVQQASHPEFKRFKGSYMTYSLGLGDPAPANSSDAKIAFAVSGDAARKMFDAMSPDILKDGTYHCNFGFDLRTGKSIGGSVC